MLRRDNNPGRSVAKFPLAPAYEQKKRGDRDFSCQKYKTKEPLAKFNGSFDLEAGIANFRIGLPRPTPEEGIPTLCSLQFPDF
jgi:hypothetical protein